MRPITFPQARQRLFSHLRENGWQVNDRLKVPHATSPDGELRLWFKPQAVYFTKIDSPRERHDFKRAYTVAYDFDIRALSPEEVVREASVRAGYRPNVGGVISGPQPVMYGYDSVRREGRSMRKNHEASIDYQEASAMAHRLIAEGYGAWPIAVKLREAGFDKAMADGIAIIMERRREVDRSLHDPRAVRTRIGSHLKSVEQMDPFWRSQYSEEEMQSAREIPRAPRSDPEAFLVHTKSGAAPSVELTADEVLADLRSQLNDREINRQQYAEGVRRLREEQTQGKTSFLRNPSFTDEEAFAALYTRMQTPLSMAQQLVEQGVAPDQATRRVSAARGLSEPDTQILHYAMDSYDPTPFDPAHASPRATRPHHFAVNRSALDVGTRAVYYGTLGHRVVTIVGYQGGSPVIVNGTIMDGTYGKPYAVSHTDLSHDAYEMQVTKAMTMIMEGTDPGEVVSRLVSDGDDVDEGFALSAMEDAAWRVSEAS